MNQDTETLLDQWELLNKQVRSAIKRGDVADFRSSQNRDVQHMRLMDGRAIGTQIGPTNWTIQILPSQVGYRTEYYDGQDKADQAC